MATDAEIEAAVEAMRAIRAWVGAFTIRPVAALHVPANRPPFKNDQEIPALKLFHWQ